MPEISILVTFCNQDNFIRRALDSIINQKLSCNYEILIGLDGERETSLKILDEYTSMYDFIHVYEIDWTKRNCINIEKASANRLNLLKHAKGKFFTILDGDDYYGDEYRLQKLKNILLENPKCIGCGSGHTLVYADGREKINVVDDFTIYDLPTYLQSGAYIHNGSVLFRNIFYFGFPKNFPYNFVNDTTMTMYMMKFGKLACIPEASYMYWIGENGIYQGVSEYLKLLYGALGAEINLQYIPEYRNFLLKKYANVFRKLYKAKRKYNFESKELDLIYTFAKENHCRLVYAVISYAKSSGVKRLYWYLFIKRIVKRRRYWGKRKIYKMAVFSGFSNFGDVMNLYIGRYVYDWCFIPVWHDADLYCIGSLLNYMCLNLQNKDNVTVVGAGMHRDLCVPQNKKTKIKILALRGKTSFESVKKYNHLGEVVLGDPAILLRKMIKQNMLKEQKYIGVIPHFYDRDSEYIKNITAENVKIINVGENPIQNIREIMECKCVLSSSLHGLIFADALGIPSQWVLFSDKVIGKEMKFEDYYSVYGIKPQPIDLRDAIIDDEKVNNIINNYKNIEEQMDEQCDKLLKIKLEE